MKKPPASPSKNGLMAAIDVGTSKICCFIARMGEDGRPHVVGIGHQPVARRARRRHHRHGAGRNGRATTVHAAEQMAGGTIEDVVLNLSGGYPASQTVGVEVPWRWGREVGEHDSTAC